MRHNQSFYCHYQQDHGYTTEDCRNLWDYLDQLVKEGKLKQLLYHSSGWGDQTGSAFQGDASSRPPLGTINVIFAAPGRTESCPSRVMSVSCCPDEGSNLMPKKVKMGIPLVLGFSDKNKLEPYNRMMMLWWLHLELVGIMWKWWWLTRVAQLRLCIPNSLRG